MTAEQPLARLPPGVDDRNRHGHMSLLANVAVDVAGAQTTVDEAVFGNIPAELTAEQAEAGGGVVVRNDTLYAFTAAFYVPSYGPKSLETRFGRQIPVAEALHNWGENVKAGFERSSRKEAFRKVFFQGGLWKVFLDAEHPGLAEVREQLARPDFGGLDKDKETLETVEKMRQKHFVRTELPHESSHADACRFANSILEVGEQELGLRTDDDKEALLARNLPHIKALALLHVRETNEAAYFMVDADRTTYQRQFLDIDLETQRIAFNMARIEAQIAVRHPLARVYVRRGCPVMFLKTPYMGREVPVFTAMNNTILRMYRRTGALANPALRHTARLRL